MIEILRFQAENFLSFEQLDYSIPKDSLTFVGGCVDEDLGKSNGAGKSSMWEVIPWVLYGKTIRGLATDDVVRRGQDEVIGSVVFQVNGEQYEVTRSRAGGKGKLKLYSKQGEISGVDNRETQKIIENVLGISFDLFINSVLFGQGLSYRFVQAPDSEKKEIFEQLLDLGWMADAQDQAKKSVAVLRLRRDELSRVKGEKSVRLSARKDEQKWLEDGIVESPESIRSAISGLETSIRLEEQLIEVKAGELSALEQRAIEKRLSVSQLQEQRIRVDRLSQSVLSEINRLSRRAAGFSAQAGEIGNLSGKPCPTCLRPIPKDYPESLYKEFSSLRGVLLGLVEQDDETKNSVLALYTALDKEIKKLETELRDIEKAKLVRKNERDEALRSIAGMQGDIAEKRVSLEALLGRTARLDSIKADIRQLQQEVSAVDDELLAVLSEEKKAEFWVEGFGNRGVKSLVLSSVLDWINEASKYFAIKLTNGELVPVFSSTSVKAGVEKEILSVSIKRGIEVVDYRTLSGGEKRRVDVVVLLTLCRLMGAVSGREVNILVFDEVFESLDTEGIENVVGVLKDFATNGRSVFVISHQEEASSLFETGVLVHKDSQGVSRLV